MCHYMLCIHNALLCSLCLCCVYVLYRLTLYCVASWISYSPTGCSVTTATILCWSTASLKSYPKRTRTLPGKSTSAQCDRWRGRLTTHLLECQGSKARTLQQVWARSLLESLQASSLFNHYNCSSCSNIGGQVCSSPQQPCSSSSSSNHIFCLLVQC